MPDQIRQNFQGLTDGQLLAACPCGLVLLGPESQVCLNPDARRVLQQLVSNQESSWNRWVAAAASRLQAGGLERELLPGVLDRRRSLEIRLAPLGESGWQMMSLWDVATNHGSRGDLTETVSTLSHELRTPLASMKSSLSLVLSQETGSLNENQCRFLDMTMRNIDRLDRLVGDLLDISQADAGRLNLRPRLLEVEEVVTETVESHRQAAVAAGLTLRFQTSGRNPSASLDGDKLVQMLGNLLSNAIKYTRSGGSVVVSLETCPGNDLLKLEVRDDGPGMDLQAQEQALLPFHRSRAAATSEVPGSGLGLHITKCLAEAHGGSLFLESRLGGGTRAWVELPMGKSLAPDQVPEAPVLLEV